ncbi:hypothetical protein A3860_18070 [Niastella vici]|uniref:Uncharacterized protein n=2 Tax=Niastella vici TaxID=1703345 RepID=A0A1V9G2D8_9BACT|nr:hypothetical protein A3860_18070 [Niastella vici]
MVNNIPILFPLEIMHSDVVQQVQQAQSAGFFVLRLNSYGVDVYCWGESTSLNLQSKQAQDAHIIKEFIGNISEVSHRFAGATLSNTQPGAMTSSAI